MIFDPEARKERLLRGPEVAKVEAVDQQPKPLAV